MGLRLCNGFIFMFERRFGRFLSFFGVDVLLTPNFIAETVHQNCWKTKNVEASKMGRAKFERAEEEFL